MFIIERNWQKIIELLFKLIKFWMKVNVFKKEYVFFLYTMKSCNYIQIVEHAVVFSVIKSINIVILVNFNHSNSE